jgi:predicted dehydrogenase
MEKVRTILVGTGYWGNNLLRNLLKTETVELVGVCDLSRPALDKVAQAHPGLETTNDYASMLEKLRPEAVVIATPAGLHHRHTLLALEHNCHVLVEKPLATGISDAREMLELALERERILMVGHTFLYNNLLHRTKQYIDSGELGDIYYLYSRRLNMGRVRTDVDALWNLAPHDVSIINYLLDSVPRRVSGNAMFYLQKDLGICDVAFARLSYSGGIDAHIHVSWLDPQKKREVVIVGSNKMLVYDDVNSDRHLQLYDKSFEKELVKEVTSFAQFQTKLRAGNLVIPNVNLREPLAAEVNHFISCVREGKTPVTDGENGLQVVAVLEAISRSIEQCGREVEVHIP